MKAPNSLGNILQLYVSDVASIGAGTAVAMTRLHKALRQRKVDSFILCEKKQSNDLYTAAFKKRGFLQKNLEQLFRLFTKNIGLNDLQILNARNIKKHAYFKQSDIVTLHGTHGWTNYSRLPTLLKGKKVVFILHDMWALTGHCAFSNDCVKYQSGCGECPYPEIYPRIRKDLTRFEVKFKGKVFSKCDITLVSPSTGMTEAVKKSVLKNLPLVQIPHGLDETIFFPRDKQLARGKFNLPENKLLIMISCVSLDDPRKGVDLLVKTLSALPEAIKNKIAVVALGLAGDALKQALPIETHCLGYISSQEEKAYAYSAADIFVHPSRAESFGLVVLEAMACGVPTVAFSIMGMTDLVRPGITGFLADYENTEQLKDGVLKLIENKKLRDEMSKQSQQIARKEFTEKKQIDRYLDLYQSL